MTSCARCGRPAEPDDFWLPIDDLCQRWTCPDCVTLDDLAAYVLRLRDAADNSREQAEAHLRWAERAEERARQVEAQIAEGRASVEGVLTEAPR